MVRQNIFITQPKQKTGGETLPRHLHMRRLALCAYLAPEVGSRISGPASIFTEVLLSIFKWCDKTCSQLSPSRKGGARHWPAAFSCISWPCALIWLPGSGARFQTPAILLLTFYCRFLNGSAKLIYNQAQTENGGRGTAPPPSHVAPGPACLSGSRPARHSACLSVLVFAPAWGATVSGIIWPATSWLQTCVGRPHLHMKNVRIFVFFFGRQGNKFSPPG